jgi:hypothetical protein
MVTTHSKENCKILLITEMNYIGDKLTPIVKTPITNILSYKSKRWIDVVGDDKKNHTVEILNLVKKIKPELTNYINGVIDSLGTHFLVFDENHQWDRINKLNTNRSDYPIFIADLLEKSTKYDIYEIYRDLKKNNFSNFIEFLNNVSKHPEFVWNNFLNNKEKYTQNIKKNSEEGEMAENFVINHYINDGWEIIYKGGDGEYIDMKLSLDLIVKKDNNYEFVQTKKVSSIEKVVIKNKNYTKVEGNVMITNSSVIDTIAYATLKGDVFIVKRQEYFYPSDEGLVKCEGLPAPSRVNKNQILVKN